MGRFSFHHLAALACAAFLAGGVVWPARGAATLTQQIQPTDVSVGDEVTVTISLNNGGGANVELPPVDGLQLEGTSTATNFTFVNGTASTSVSQIFTLVPQRAGDFTIPGFDVHASDGQVLHAHEMKLHVVNGSAVPNAAAAPGGGPVVVPPAASDENQGATNGGAAEVSGGTIKPPLDPDGRPAKVFMLITPTTTDAYVGQAIPLRIEFFIRMDSLAQQDSLPTIKGSDFLMNDLSLRPEEDEPALGDEPYHRETWMTAISAPKAGDFPLEMERDTYWTKTPQGLFSDPLGNFFAPGMGRLSHGNVPSNPLVIHVHALPEEGRPEDFTGAIGQFRAEGKAAPDAVNVGEPVYIDFSVTGQGNFDRVRCPALAPDPAWKAYVPSAKVTYTDESHTEGEKTFHQALIPEKNGTLPLPAARFSYFDPTDKKYVTLPIDLPAVTVSGTTALPAPSGTAQSETSAPAAAPANDNGGLLPNRLEFGSVRTDLVPPFRQPWFWAVQAGALLCVVLVAPWLLLRSRRQRDDVLAARNLRRRSLHDLEQAMHDAVQRGDAPAFFLAARQAVQLRWGAAWGLRPEAVTLAAMAEREPALAERLAPLFAQADEVMYSGQAAGGLDLEAWEHLVRDELRQLQPV